MSKISRVSMVIGKSHTVSYNPQNLLSTFKNLLLVLMPTSWAVQRSDYHAFLNDLILLALSQVWCRKQHTNSCFLWFNQEGTRYFPLKEQNRTELAWAPSCFIGKEERSTTNEWRENILFLSLTRLEKKPQVGFMKAYRSQERSKTNFLTCWKHPTDSLKRFFSCILGQLHRQSYGYIEYFLPKTTPSFFVDTIQDVNMDQYNGQWFGS